MMVSAIAALFILLGCAEAMQIGAWSNSTSTLSGVGPDVTNADGTWTPVALISASNNVHASTGAVAGVKLSDAEITTLMQAGDNIVRLHCGPCDAYFQAPSGSSWCSDCTQAMGNKMDQCSLVWTTGIAGPFQSSGYNNCHKGADCWQQHGGPIYEDCGGNGCNCHGAGRVAGTLYVKAGAAVATTTTTTTTTTAAATAGSTDQYWKFRMAQGNAIYEIQFYSGSQLVPTGTTNGVASANVDVAGTTYVTASNMFDGNLGHWSGGAEVYWQSYVADAWVQYYFYTAPPPITRVVITWYGGTYVSDLSVGPCYIDSSSDGATWTTQYTINQGDTCCPQNTWDITLAPDPPTTTTAAATAGVAGAGGGAAAVGDPHLQNVHGERFDLMKTGKHVLVNIPRGVNAKDALLRVQANARRLGGQCADMYFQELNVTGSWTEEKKAGGYHYSVLEHDVMAPKWLAFGPGFRKVELKVVHGRTDSGLHYLNVYVKNLGHAGYAVGGLLGEDDHQDVIAPPEGCDKRMSLLEYGEGHHASVASLAVASF